MLELPTGPDPLLGQTIADRFVVERQIGEGGMGTVYLARQEPVGRMVALKVLLPQFVSDRRKMGRFINEARILGGLRHPHTVRLVDFGHLPGGQLYIAMEYLAGGTLEDAIERGRLPELVALRITRQILGALVEAHSHGLVHRDLKPSNVLFDHVAGEHAMVRVADFGIARFNPLERSESTPPAPVAPVKHSFGLQAIETIPGMRLGSPAYISPEQAFAKAVDARSDLYSLGVMVYEMLTGHTPFDAEDAKGLYLAQAHQQAPPLNSVPGMQVDPATEALVARMLSKDREGRPGSAAEALDVVDDVLDRLGPKTKPPADLGQLPATPRPVDDSDVVLASSGPPGWVWGLGVGGVLVLVALWLVR